MDFFVCLQIADGSGRQIALQKFVRMGGEVQSPALLVPFMEMLSALSATEKTAPLCFELLSNGQLAGGSSFDVMISWDHFIRSIER
jgi:hypothetical protein